MSDRVNQLVSDILRRIHEAIVENDITYEEYQAAKQWFIDVGEAGEWPLFGDVYIEHVVEEQAFGNRQGSQGTILGPFHLPDAPRLDAPFFVGDRFGGRRQRHPVRDLVRLEPASGGLPDAGTAPPDTSPWYGWPPTPPASTPAAASDSL